jgi:hypothetical protein
METKAMSEVEHLKRLVARSRSDVRRAVPFIVGYNHFSQLITFSIDVMDQKIKQLENIVKRIEKRR